MIFVEDSKTYQLRKITEFLRQQDECCRKRAARIHPCKQHILDIVQESGDEPIRITSVANRFAKEMGHRWKSRAEREELKKQAFRLIGELLKGFFLERCRRKWVRWIPPDNPRRKAFEQKVEEIIRNLPPPNI